MQTSSGSDHVLIVLGHRAPGDPSRHLIGEHARHRVCRAEELAAAGNFRAVILSGWSSVSSQPSEAQQMAAMWKGTKVPLILEERSRSTAENAAFCLPIVQSLSGVRKVTIVSCNWHIRALYHFAEYRRYGIDVSFAPADDRLTVSLRPLLTEIRLLLGMSGARRRAFARGGLGLAG